MPVLGPEHASVSPRRRHGLRRVVETGAPPRPPPAGGSGSVEPAISWVSGESPLAAASCVDAESVLGGDRGQRLAGGDDVDKVRRGGAGSARRPRPTTKMSRKVANACAAVWSTRPPTGNAASGLSPCKFAFIGFGARMDRRGPVTLSGRRPRPATAPGSTSSPSASTYGAANATICRAMPRAAHRTAARRYLANMAREIDRSRRCSSPPSRPPAAARATRRPPPRIPPPRAARASGRGRRARTSPARSGSGGGVWPSSASDAVGDRRPRVQPALVPHREHDPPAGYENTPRLAQRGFGIDRQHRLPTCTARRRRSRSGRSIHSSSSRLNSTFSIPSSLGAAARDLEHLSEASLQISEPPGPDQLGGEEPGLTGPGRELEHALPGLQPGVLDHPGRHRHARTRAGAARACPNRPPRAPSARAARPAAPRGSEGSVSAIHRPPSSEVRSARPCGRPPGTRPRLVPSAGAGRWPSAPRRPRVRAAPPRARSPASARPACRPAQTASRSRARTARQRARHRLAVTVDVLEHGQGAAQRDPASDHLLGDRQQRRAREPGTGLRRSGRARQGAPLRRAPRALPAR